MAYKKTDKLIQYNNAYNKDNYDRITVLVRKGRKAEIKARADANRESVNAFINRAIEKLLAESE